MLPRATFRSVPSAGSCHPYETYLVVRNVEGLDPGLYRYLAISHKLEVIEAPASLGDRGGQSLQETRLGQKNTVFFIWA